MIKKETVLVLGAGASVDYGFPTGAKLRSRIVAELRAEGPLFQLLSKMGDRPDEAARLSRFAEELNGSGVPSVDRYLAQRRQDDPEGVERGRRAIAAALLMAEDGTKLLDRSDEPRWFEDLWDRLTHDVIAPTAFSLGNRISVITFNYDRSLEHAIYNWAQILYREGADELLNNLFPILHVHGLMEDADPRAINYRAVGSELTMARVENAARRIVLPDDEEGTRIAGHRANLHLAEAETVCFLGFGFNRNNLRRLLPGLCKTPKRVVATGIGLGSAEREGAQALINERASESPKTTIEWSDKPIGELLRQVLE